MDARIIYQPATGPAAVLMPIDCGLSVLDIGKKDVPAGLPFWIVDSSAIPQDRTFRDAWELDAASLGTPSGVGTYKEPQA